MIFAIIVSGEAVADNFIQKINESTTTAATIATLV